MTEERFFDHTHRKHVMNYRKIFRLFEHENKIGKLIDLPLGSCDLFTTVIVWSQPQKPPANLYCVQDEDTIEIDEGFSESYNISEFYQSGVV